MHVINFRSAFLAALVALIFLPISFAQSTPFHDDFNRAAIGVNYDGPLGLYYAPPVLNGIAYVVSDLNKNSVSILQPSAGLIGPNQFARETMVNSTAMGTSSLFLRTTLLPDKSGIATGYELDYGRLWDDSGDWWTLYYKDASGFHVVQDVYFSLIPITAGSVVEFRASGSNLQFLINGQVEWTGTHTGVTTGAPGVGVSGDSIVDEFFAGDIVPAPPLPAPTIGAV